MACALLQAGASHAPLRQPPRQNVEPPDEVNERRALESQAVGVAHRVDLNLCRGLEQRPGQVMDLAAPRPPATVDGIEAVTLRQPLQDQISCDSISLVIDARRKS